ncbi:hypothetical protein J6590_089255, partial [Homalodisca vitripennis]
ESTVAWENYTVSVRLSKCNCILQATDTCTIVHQLRATDTCTIVHQLRVQWLEKITQYQSDGATDTCTIVHQLRVQWLWKLHISVRLSHRHLRYCAPAESTVAWENYTVSVRLSHRHLHYCPPAESTVAWENYTVSVRLSHRHLRYCPPAESTVAWENYTVSVRLSKCNNCILQATDTCTIVHQLRVQWLEKIHVSVRLSHRHLRYCPPAESTATDTCTIVHQLRVQWLEKITQYQSDGATDTCAIVHQLRVQWLEKITQHLYYCPPAESTVAWENYTVSVRLSKCNNCILQATDTCTIVRRLRVQWLGEMSEHQSELLSTYEDLLEATAVEFSACGFFPVSMLQALNVLGVITTYGLIALQTR